MTFLKSSDTTRGGALFIILMAIALLGALSWAVISATEQQTTAPTSIQIGDQIARLLSQSAALAGAVGQMASVGDQAPVTLAGTGTGKLDSTAPGGAGWDAAPHGHKIYHPLGGGTKYISQTGTGTTLSEASNLANNFRISRGSIIQDVGDTNTVGDIVFTASVASLSACRKINQTVLGTAANAAPPVMGDTGFSSMIVNGTDTDVDTAVCPLCRGVSQACVGNASGTAWGYYRALLPQ